MSGLVGKIQSSKRNDIINLCLAINVKLHLCEIVQIVEVVDNHLVS